MTALDRLTAATGKERPSIIPECNPASLEAISDADVGTLLLVDPLPDAVDPVASAARGMSIGDAVRPHAMRLVFAFELAKRAERTIVLSPATPPEDWLAALAEMLDSPAAPILDLLSSFPSSEPDAESLPEDGDGRAAMAYLQALDMPKVTAPSLSVVWPRELFLAGDAPGTVLPPTVEIAGRPRILAYGPYLPLPTGNWSATAFLGFSRDAVRLPFILEIDTGGHVTRCFFEVERGGIFSLDLDFELTVPLQLMEVRLISQDSSLEGQVSLIELTLRRVGMPGEVR